MYNLNINRNTVCIAIISVRYLCLYIVQCLYRVFLDAMVSLLNICRSNIEIQSVFSLRFGMGIYFSVFTGTNRKPAKNFNDSWRDLETLCIFLLYTSLETLCIYLHCTTYTSCTYTDIHIVLYSCTIQSVYCYVAGLKTRRRGLVG